MPKTDLDRKTIRSLRNKKLKLTLPLPPSVNSLHFRTSCGGVKLTGEAKRYIVKAQRIIEEEIKKQRWLCVEKNVWLYIDLVVFMPDKRCRDSHNLLKLLLDVMQGLVFVNDYYVMPRIQSVELDKENPRIDLTISLQSEQNREQGLKIAGVS